MSALERVLLPLPEGFDPSRHSRSLPAALAKKRGEGPDDPPWEIESLNLPEGTATLVRQVSVMQVRQSSADDMPEALEVKLPMGTRPTDGDKVAARQADAHPGYHLVQFEPHVGKAILARLNDDELRCRGAVATALSVKPWDVMVAQRRDGGYSVQLPGAYVPSKHDSKLQEVAETAVGRFGWYVTIDTRNLVAQIIPSDPPSFDDVIPTPLAALGSDPMRTPFGLRLPLPGKKASEQVEIDWGAQSHGLVSGLPGSGKTVTLSTLIADHLAAGGELVIADVPQKALDFLWAKPYVRDGGWGCDGLRSSITALMLMYEEGQRRAEWMAERGYVNWLDIPEADRFPPILAIVDEVSALLVTEKLPAGVDKDLPEVKEVIEENRLKFKLQRRITKIIAEQRFVGMRVILSTQVTNNTTGLPPSLKALLGQKILQGPNPSKTQRQQAFNVEPSVPWVPENLRAGGMAAKGVGAAELEGQAPCVYKSFFATTDALGAELDRRAAPRTQRPEPTLQEMDRLCPAGEEADLDAEPEAVTVGERSDFGKEEAPTGEDGKPLKGAAAAAKASKRQSGPPCPSCDRPIDPSSGECGCSW